MRKRAALDFGVPLLVLLAITLYYRSPERDLGPLDRYYLGDRVWKYEEPQPWKSFYDFGPSFSIVVGAWGLAVWIAGYFRPGLARHRKTAAFLALSLAIGPGIVVNSIFKEHWGRPRPRDIVRYDGDRTYWKVWERHRGGDGDSFPSGHAATAYWLFTPWFLLRRRRRRWAIGVLALGLVWGTIMGICRMGQGGHYPSDVVWAGGFAYLVSLSLFYWMRFEKAPGGS